MIVLQLLKVKRTNSIRPHQCPYCKGETFQRWGQVQKGLKDTKVRTAQVYRYRCNHCKRTFRHYPEGISRAGQSLRMKQLAVIMWSLGLSYRGVEAVLSAFGVSLSRMSSWRDVQAAGEALRGRLQWKMARVVGVDGAWLHGKGILVAVDLGAGELLSIGEIDEKDPGKVKRWLRELKQRHQISALVTDDLATYKELADDLELTHQVCQFHVRRWVGRRLSQLEEVISADWLWVLEEIRELVDTLPPTGGKRLHEIWKQMPGRTTAPQEERTPLEKLRDLVLRLSRDWQRYIEFYSDPGIPWTNNATEQTIEKLKMRARTTRGYKTSSGLVNAVMVSCASLV